MPRYKEWTVAIECGQSMFRRRCWRRTPSDDNLFRFRKWKHSGGHGFAFGPVMFYTDIDEGE